ncbi:MAG TPA: GNAT family N-acetyltransferase [Aggregatilineales bacterium]|nr:GNAT family N-acetyltransferase [Anaerolineales bacterium]HRE49277.1 GNAT family N-acetyltransferase [Aggregatilineales bacterium]
MPIPTLDTERLLIREFRAEDGEGRRTLIEEGFESAITHEQNDTWLRWMLLNYRALENLYQPPYGDYAITLKTTGDLIGAVGLVPSVIPWGVLPAFRVPEEAPHTLISPEFGLFWVIGKAHRRQGYAAEAARGLITYLFDELSVRRVIAQTDHANLASQAVMRSLGMAIYHNPGDTPFWFEVVGVLNHPSHAHERR